MNIWNGVFAPVPMLQKHRDYCGDMTNHLAMTDFEPWTQEKEDDIKYLKDIEDIVRLVPEKELGKNPYKWLVRVEFVPNGDQWYDFIYVTPDEGLPDEAEVIGLVEGYFEPDPEG